MRPQTATDRYRPTVVATAMGLIGTWASVAGNEVSIRLGRQRLVRLAMTSCVVCAAGIGFLGTHSYPLAAALVLVYGLLIWLDSSSLTAGAAGSADPRRRGATLALHSLAGYTGGFVGPIMIGWDPRSRRRKVPRRLGFRVPARRRDHPRGPARVRGAAAARPDRRPDGVNITLNVGVDTSEGRAELRIGGRG